MSGIEKEFPYAKYVDELPVHHDTDPIRIEGEKIPEDPNLHPVHHPLRFGGLDLAKRIDHSAMIMLKWDGGILKQEGHLIWPHVNYSKVAEDVKQINRKKPCEMIGFDRSGVGDAASELFDKSEIPLNPIVTTMNTKIDIIHIIRGLFDKRILQVDKMSELPRQISEQEEQVTDAGNLKYSHPPDSHDDLFWALGYACYTAIPWIINMPPVNIKQGHDGLKHYERNVDEEINRLMGDTDSLQSFG